MRCEVQPLLADVFGAGYLKNISTIGGDSAELAELTVKYVFGPFWKTLRIDNVHHTPTPRLKAAVTRRF